MLAKDPCIRIHSSKIMNHPLLKDDSQKIFKINEVKNSKFELSIIIFIQTMLDAENIIFEEMDE